MVLHAAGDLGPVGLGHRAVDPRVRLVDGGGDAVFISGQAPTGNPQHGRPIVIQVAKLDVEENQSTAMKYGIMSVPTLLFMKGGKVADQVVGNVPREAIEERIAKVL